MLLGAFLSFKVVLFIIRAIAVFVNWFPAKLPKEEAQGDYHYAVEYQYLSHKPEVHQGCFSNAPLTLEVDDLHVDQNSHFKDEENTHNRTNTQSPFKSSKVQ